MDINIDIGSVREEIKNILEKSNLIPVFRGIKIDDPRWTKEDLITLCTIFAIKWHKAEEDYHQEVLRRLTNEA